jgi:acetyl esterase/lipase
MASKQMEDLTILYGSWVAASAKNPNMTLAELRDQVETWPVVAAEPGGVDYGETDAGGVPAMWIVPKGCAKDRVILCLHGGGFVGGSMYSHRKAYAHLAKAIGCRALVPNYRLTPEHPHPAQLEDALAAYRFLLSEGVPPSHIAVGGDSAGGGLAISLLLAARDRGLALPAACLPLSPWTDMDLTGETYGSNHGKDALFSKEMIGGLVFMRLGPSGNRRDPLVSPIYGDLRRLPPMYIQVGGDELLVDDSRSLAKAAVKAGVEVHLEIVPGMQHNFLFTAGRAPEADEGIRRWADWARPKLGLGA